MQHGFSFGARLTVARLTPEQESRVWDAAARATKFFMGTADVQKALAKLVAALEGYPESG